MAIRWPLEIGILLDILDNRAILFYYLKTAFSFLLSWLTASNLNELGLWLAAEILLTQTLYLSIRYRAALHGGGSKGTAHQNHPSGML